MSPVSSSTKLNGNLVCLSYHECVFGHLNRIRKLFPLESVINGNCPGSATKLSLLERNGFGVTLIDLFRRFNAYLEENIFIYSRHWKFTEEV